MSPVYRRSTFCVFVCSNEKNKKWISMTVVCVCYKLDDNKILCIKVEIISIMTSYIALQISVYYTQQIDDSVAASLKVTRKAKGKSRKFKFFGNRRPDTCMRIYSIFEFLFRGEMFQKVTTTPILVPWTQIIHENCNAI